MIGTRFNRYRKLGELGWVGRLVQVSNILLQNIVDFGQVLKYDCYIGKCNIDHIDRGNVTEQIGMLLLNLI